ncbi:putative type VI secretion system effector [Iodobacter sp. CM08]|uniref:putative type VI secretion system effector n=1 Tax=Iodobacter sp. CM08 TaxID=3085902 RepID=UPI002980BA0A|nr:putative type VI secretion system effector [Iodobacter sp. CM08]MDW5419222.1 putative type VI secretion system effector [Iodobacter sp. CM08]
MLPIEPPPSTSGLVKISGLISNYKSTREHANFFFTQNDNKAMSLAAIASAAIGSSGLAMGAAISASDMEEEADYVEFEMDGKAIKGWVWRSPFANNDIVDVVGEWRDNYFELVAIARPADRTIALYPHCSRGKRAHIKNAIKWWFLGVTGMFGLTAAVIALQIALGESLISILVASFCFLVPPLMWLFFGKKGLLASMGLLFSPLIYTYSLDDFILAIRVAWPAPVVLYIFMGIFAILYSRKTMKFVNVATYVFDALGLENPSNIDLPKTSQAELLKLIKERKVKKENEAIKESKKRKNKKEIKDNSLLSQSEMSLGSMYFKY